MSPDSQFAAMLDSFGRIWIWSVLRCRFSRILKGYRRAQIAWCSVNKDLEKLAKTQSVKTSDLEMQCHSQRGGRSLDVHQFDDCTNESVSDPVAPDQMTSDSQHAPFTQNDGTKCCFLFF